MASPEDEEGSGFKLTPLVALAALITLVGLYENWDSAFTQPWWIAVAGGACLAALHFAAGSASGAMGVIGAVLLVMALLGVPLGKLVDRAAFSALALGLLAGLGVGYLVKSVRGGSKEK